MNVRTISIVRSVGILGATAALMATATFAAFQTNTVTLSDNTLSVDENVLQIWDGAAFGGTATGFAFTVMPGTESAQQPFYLKNLSGANLALSAMITPAVTGTAINLNKVHVKIFDKDGTTVLLNKTVNELTAGDELIGDQLNAGATGDGSTPGTEGNYSVSVSVEATAPTGNPSSIGAFDLNFVGTPL